MCKFLFYNHLPHHTNPSKPALINFASQTDIKLSTKYQNSNNFYKKMLEVIIVTENS